MCKTCGCEDKKMKKGNEYKKGMKGIFSNILKVGAPVSEANDEIAREIMHELEHRGILCVNMMGAPGSGKTTVIEGIAKSISPKEMFVIQGDLESDVDKKRLEKSRIDCYQINTHSGCHLNASMIMKALKKIKLDGKKYLIIENVGNLVCPAGVKIGQNTNLVVSSTTEGSDKPKKYPYIFMDADLIVISKSDLASYVGFDEKNYLKDLKGINGRAVVVKTSAKNKGSFREAAHFIEHEREHLLMHMHGHEHHHH